MNNRFLSTSTWQGEDRIDIREWNLGEKTFPTRKGISLTLSRWKLLSANADEITSTMQGRKNSETHLGGNVFATVSKDFPFRVDIRQFWIPKGEVTPKATRKGVSLTFQEWKGVVESVKELEEDFPLLKEVVPCLLSEDHQNQEGMLKCAECTPASHAEWM